MTKIVITGATGFVGRELVPRLTEASAELLLVGRDPKRLAALFPNHARCGYDDLPERAAGYDVLFHLAVVNNDTDSPCETFFETNVNHMMDTAESAKRAKISRFVNVSSVHALNEADTGPYAQSKREAAARLTEISGIDTVSVYLPAVYGSAWSGRWAFLNRLPRPLAGRLFSKLSALLPTVHVAHLAAFALRPVAEPLDAEIVLSDGQAENMTYHVVARMIDLAAAAGIVLFLWWVFAIVWVAIRLNSSGPAVFAQTRVGRRGTEFTCYKFRTMKVGTAQLGTDKVSASAVTGIGAFLRRTKLDELPQVLNIFRNEMGLVGPRPCLPVQAELVAERQSRGVMELKPGITGLAQINGIDMSDPRKLAIWDGRYLGLQSLLIDFQILSETALGKGQGDKITKFQ